MESLIKEDANVDVKINTLSDVSREVEISVSASEIQTHFDKAYMEYRPKVEIKGFRKGKAPLELVKKLYGDMIEQETLPSVASELYRGVVKEKELKPIGDPVITDMQYHRGENFLVKIQYDIRPTIDLKDYRGVAVENPVHTVTDEEVEEEISRLLKMDSTTEAATGVSDDEYVISGQMQELDPSGVPLIGKKTQGARFYLADPQLEKPIHDALRNAQVGGEYRVVFQHQHGDHAHDVNLRITVSTIERLVLPEFDAVFVKKVTKDKISDPEEFRKKLREDLHEYWKEKSRRHVVNSVIGEIVRRHDFQIPESLIRSVLEGLLEDVKNQYPKKQLPQDFDHERFFQESRAYAIYQSKWALIREEIVKAERIDATDEDLLVLAEKESSRIGIDKDRLTEYYKSSDQIKDRLVSEKLIEFLVGLAKITEVPHKDPNNEKDPYV
ncbi:MAG: trigger factor [Bacteroidota bacterium]